MQLKISFCSTTRSSLHTFVTTCRDYRDIAATCISARRALGRGNDAWSVVRSSCALEASLPAYRVRQARRASSPRSCGQCWRSFRAWRANSHGTRRSVCVRVALPPRRRPASRTMYDSVLAVGEEPRRCNGATRSSLGRSWRAQRPRSSLRSSLVVRRGPDALGRRR
eukprot:SAG11_NODE_13601_length_647_cov_2.593066_1_plen_166_part_01